MKNTMHRYRTHTCGELRTSHLELEVGCPAGFETGAITAACFLLTWPITTAVTQLIVAPGSPAHDLLGSLPKETVIRVDGTVIAREAGQVNPGMVTGEVEVKVTEAEILGPTAPLPFSVFPEVARPKTCA